MDNHHFPPLEPDEAFPESLPEIPQQMEPLEEMPVIEELVFKETPPATTEAPSVAESELPMEEEAPCAEIAPVEENLPAAIPSAEEVQPEIAVEHHDEDFPEFPMALNETLTADSTPPEDMPPLEVPTPQISEETPDQEYRDDSQEFEAMFHAPAAKQARYSIFPSPPSTGDFIKSLTNKSQLLAQSTTFLTARKRMFLSLTIPFLFNPFFPHSNCGLIKAM